MVLQALAPENIVCFFTDRVNLYQINRPLTGIEKAGAFLVKWTSEKPEPVVAS